MNTPAPTPAYDPAVIRGLLLDIEGTTSSITFVFDVLFPYARAHLAGFLDSDWDDPVTASALDQVARDAGSADFDAWAAAQPTPARDALERRILGLMAADAKATGLKQIQGLIWRQGYEAGELISHVYDDVEPALIRWRAAGLDLRIYSSGSIQAQRQFFAHTERGNLLPHLTGHYDTAVGPKRAHTSYAAITRDWGLPAGAILFLSDVVDELDAARTAGMATTLMLRPGNPAPPPSHGHPTAATFDNLP